MRHSSPVLTANIYTDPRLLDVQGAVEALPDLPLSGPSAPMTESVRATGTDNEASRKVPPMLPPGAVPTVHSESFPVTSGKLESLALDSDSDVENSDKPTKKARILTEKDSGHQSGRHDLNVRPPAPKAGDDANDTNENGSFPALAADASANASPRHPKNNTETAPDPPRENGFTAAMQIIASLPLSDVEKAEAIRRLLADRDA